MFLPSDILDFPAASFIRFHDNHGLLQWGGRPVWRTVSDGSRSYVKQLIRPFAERIKRDAAIVAVRRANEGVVITDATGMQQHYDHVVLATHADQALAMLEDSTPTECELLGAFRYSRNLAVLHTDTTFMPKRRAVWSSWNYVSEAGACHEGVCVTYWMNLLQNLVTDKPLFVTLNPPRAPAAGTLLHSEIVPSPDLRRRRDGCSTTPVALAGRAQHLVLWRLFRRGLSRGRTAVGTCCRRGARRRTAAVAGGERIGPNFLGTWQSQRGTAAMTPTSALYVGTVVHRRVRPRRHQFRYRAFWLLLDLDELAGLSSRLRLFSHNHANVFSLYDADHGDGTFTGLRLQVERELASVGVDIAGGAIKLLFMPRTLGYSFNPLSVYFCHDANGRLAALVYQVHNTFGERHSYVIPVQGDADTICQHCEKRLYVSPFMEMNLQYRFRVKPPVENVTIAVHAQDRAGVIFTAALAGSREDFTDRMLLRVLLRIPLITIKVIAAIHWEALRLWLKGNQMVPRSEARERAI